MPTKRKAISGRMTLDKPEIDLSLKKNFEVLDADRTRIHLDTLSRSLRMLSRLVYEKIPEHGGKNAGFQQYLIRLGDTLDSIILKNKIDGMEIDKDFVRECSIDPTDSGFPVILRDFYYLDKDKHSAPQKLEQIPDDASLVNEAEFSVYRGVFPHDIIKTKLERNYYKKLSELELPHSMKIYPDEYLQKEGNKHYLVKAVEKLDENNNLPRFYAIHLKAPKQSYASPKWREEIDVNIKQGLSTLADYELRLLPKLIEPIEGIQLQMIERFDIGPFYNSYTSNNETIRLLLEGSKETDAVLAFRKRYTARIEETRKQGFKAFVKGLFSGDWHTGVFSPVINTPVYMLMPHRLIQRAYNLGLDFGGEVQLFGINETGDLIG